MRDAGWGESKHKRGSHGQFGKESYSKQQMAALKPSGHGNSKQGVGKIFRSDENWKKRVDEIMARAKKKKNGGYSKQQMAALR